MDITVNAQKPVRRWKHIERFQNTTLRYTPAGDFPEVMEKTLGRPEIVRLFITLDEVWDNRSDEYDWNYRIGVNKFANDPNHDHYDWPLTEPSPFGTHVEEYLTSHATHADQVLLNIRRYEQEVVKGQISLEKYGQVFRKVVEHFKELCPNIVWIEVCNEVEGSNFGRLNMDQYYSLYKEAAKAVRELNKEHDYLTPLKVGGFGQESGVTHYHFWRRRLELLAADPDRIIDYYSFHDYHMNPGRLLEFYVRHKADIKELNLPDLPMLVTEYGMRTGPGDAGRPHNLQNAGGEIPGLILSSYCDDMYVFPWCSFHNPSQQLGRTMFIQKPDGSYIPTPSGHTMTMFSRLGGQELWIDEYTFNHAVATSDEKGKICVLMTNTNPALETMDLHVIGLSEGTYLIRQFLVDSFHNNCLTDPSCISLQPTKEFKAAGNRLDDQVDLEEYAFCLYEIVPCLE